MSVFSSLRGGSRPLLFSLFRTLCREPRLLLLGLASLVGRDHTGLFSSDLLQLSLGKVGVKPVGILGQECFPSIARPELKRQLVVTANGGLRIGLRRRHGRPCRNQRHVIATKRAVNIGLLLVAGDLEHVVTNKPESTAKIEAGLRQMLDECRGVRAVLRVPV